jgi:Flp pilus assembly protein TadD
MALERNDMVVTRWGTAVVRFSSDGSQLRIAADSRVQINESAGQRDIEVFLGKLWARIVAWRDRPVRFKTGSTIAAVRGTELALDFDGDKALLSVLEGEVMAENPEGSLLVEGGRTAMAAEGQAPAFQVVVRPQDAVQWALYYLPVIYAAPDEIGEGEDWQRAVRESMEAFWSGDLAGALDRIEEVSDAAVRDARFFNYRASLLLAAASFDEAAADIDRAAELKANDADTLSLETIIAVVRNEKDEALATADRAVGADRQSVTALIAKSYAQQAAFDLEGARATLEQAVELKSANALAWARLAELHMSFGNLGDALDAARKAAELEPNMTRAQTVLGYAYLTQVRVNEAKDAFTKAIELDQGDPVPRLGLGLAMIRQGSLNEGTREIEVAASLDPGNALMRSYLGKSYFEAKRIGLDDREYKLAKELDPLDPTPWFYDAIAKQTTNQPVAALRDMEQAIELNDNRAIYRSRLLLDADLAARSSSLGRVYSDLGFQQLALVEGWNSVNIDPGNFSAHRLLADSYAARPRHEIARVSELFQSQMLQPLNTTPIQPSLGESNLFLITAQGPGILAFNEFNPLFNRDQVNVQGGFVYGEDDTVAGEGIVSGIYKKLSFSAGYAGFKTDGFRENNQQDDQIGNAFVQVELGPSTSIQAEARYRKLEAGDLSLNFFEEDFKPLATREEERTTARVGLRQDIGSAVTILASYMHADQDTIGSDPDPFLGLDIDLDFDNKADSFEGQLLYRSPMVKVVGGAGYFDIDTVETLVVDAPFLGFTTISTNDETLKHTNLYAYSYLNLANNLTLTAGLSGDLFDETGETSTSVQIPGLPAFPPESTPAEVLGEQDQINPKVGIMWRAASGTTLRAAWFKTMKRSLITDQTLEPTQVAGFNQFFDDFPATEAKVYGAAIDQKFGGRAFGGVQYTERELTIPVTTFELVPEISVTVDRFDGDEREGRAYLFVAPHPWVTFGAEYLYEKLELDPELGIGTPYSTVRTHRVPLSARFFHPNGISAFVGVTYFDQEGEFATVNMFGETEFVPGQRDFWVVDAGVRYRLPKRYGFIVAGVNNLTDERSTYQATDPRNLTIRPGRVVFARVVVAFP